MRGQHISRYSPPLYTVQSVMSPASSISYTSQGHDNISRKQLIILLRLILINPQLVNLFSWFARPSNVDAPQNDG